MIKLLIVDDQKQVRKGLINTVNWNRLGYEVVTDVGSAEEAIEVIEETTVEVVLTDIVMLEMDGLNLVDYIKKHDMKIKTVILSAYQDFKYAKEAIHLDVEAYLTKPVDFNELYKTFTNIGEQIQEEEKIENKYKQLTEIKKKEMISELLFENYSKLMEAHEYYELFGMDFLHLYFQVLILRFINAINDEMAEYVDKIQNIINETFDKCYVYPINESEYVILVASTLEVNDIYDRLSTLIILEKEINNMIIHTGIGNLYHDYKNISTSYKEALEALNLSGVYRINHIQHIKDINENGKNPLYVISKKQKTELLSYLIQNDNEKLLAFIKKILNENIEVKSLDMKSYCKMCVEILFVVSSFLSENYETDTIDSVAIDFKDIFNEISIIQIEAYLLEKVKDILFSVRSLKMKESHFLVNKIKDYINNNYFDELSLYAIAEKFYVHHTHLCRIFKDKTGTNFVDYVTEVRINRATELLTDYSLKVYNVGSLVGFKDPKYFSKRFKEYKGMTPSQYRKIYLSKGNSDRC